MSKSAESMAILANADAATFPEGPYPKAVQIKLEESLIEMTLRKVSDYRPVAGLTDDWTKEGPPPKEMNRMAKAWASEYQWRDVEKKLNDDFQHYATVVQETAGYPHPVPLHFIHHPSDNKEAMPLLLLHGWPSSSVEWRKVIKGLSSNPDQAFHVVAPDLPGFGFSPAPTQPGLGPREMGKVFDGLMKQLGYDKYGVATTDLGWTIGMWMVNDLKENILGHMCDFFMVPPNEDDQQRMQKGTLSTEESEYMMGIGAWFASHSAYSTTHSQKPLALSLALGDSPVGLLGWCWDLIRTASDGYQYTDEELITDVMMLWVPGPYGNIRSYLEFFKPENMNTQPSTVPTGVSQWGWSNSPFPAVAKSPLVPESWIKRVANVQYFSRHESGGHFPAVSEPELWMQDVRAFFYR